MRLVDIYISSPVKLDLLIFDVAYTSSTALVGFRHSLEAGLNINIACDSKFFIIHRIS